MSARKILFLSEDDIKKVLSMEDTIELMRDAFRQISQGTVTVPIRTNIDIPDQNAGALFMPVHSAENDLIALKMVSVFKNNPSINLPLIHALVILMDGKNGQPLAVLDGEYVTALRTGAGSGLATDLLARTDAKVLGIFGAGVQGKTQMLAVCQVRDIDQIIVVDRDPEAASQLAEFVTTELGKEVIVDPTARSISQCDIICTATTSPNPVFSDTDLKDGVHINAIGAYQPDKREIPGETIKRAKLVVDQTAACMDEAGDVIIPIRAKLIHESHIYAELGEIVLGAKMGRESDSEITVFKSVGNAAQDLVTAGRVLSKASESGIGIFVSL